MTLADDEGETQARFVDGQRGIEITATDNQIRIEGPNDEYIGNFATFPDPGDTSFSTNGNYRVVTTTGISCQGTGAARQPADDDTGTPQSADDGQYGAEPREAVIPKTIPDKILVDTGGPGLPMLGLLLLSVGLVGLGILVLRRV